MARFAEAPPTPAIVDFHQDISATGVNGGKNHLQRHSLSSPVPVLHTAHEQANSTDIPRLVEGGFKVVFGAAFVVPLYQETSKPLPQRDFCMNIAVMTQYMIYCLELLTFCNR
jgi:hypothetical protein